MICSRCGEDGTDYVVFSTSEYKPEVESWIGKIMVWLVILPPVEIHICQRCQSIMFRNLDKEK